MSQIIPPSPVDSPFGSYNWDDWYEKVRRAINNATGTIPTTQGGTGFTSYSAGDILYGTAGNILAKLPIGSNGKILTVVGGLPVWQTAGGFYGTNIAQPTTAVASAARVAGATAALVTDTYDGYTLAQVVKALRNLGVLA